MTVLFDTTTVDPAERSGSWLEVHRRTFFPIGVRFAAEDASQGTIRSQPFGPLGAYRVVSDPSQVRRTSAEIRAFDPEQLLVATPLRGHTVIEQEDRMSAFGTGDLSSWDSSHPTTSPTARRSTCCCSSCPGRCSARAAISSAVARRGGSRTARRSARSRHRFFRQVWESLQDETARGGHEDLADGVIALIRALHRDEHGEGAPTRAVPGAALLPQLKAYVDHHLGGPAARPGVDRPGALHLDPLPAETVRPGRDDGVRLGPASPPGGVSPRSPRPGARPRDDLRDRRPLGAVQSGALQPHLPRGLRHHPERAATGCSLSPRVDSRRGLASGGPGWPGASGPRPARPRAPLTARSRRSHQQ